MGSDLTTPARAAVEAAWRAGFQAARECLAEDEAFCLTADVEADALADAALPIPDEPEAMIARVAAAIYAEDDVWATAIPFEKLDEMDQAAYERIALAALRAARSGGRDGGE